jgi:hypothetical protein
VNFIEIHPGNVNTTVTTDRSIQDLVHSTREFDLPQKALQVKLPGTTRTRTELRVGDGKGGAVVTVAAQLTQKAEPCLSRALGTSDGLSRMRYLRVLIKA